MRHGTPDNCVQAHASQDSSHTAEYKVMKVVLAACRADCVAAVHMAQRFQSDAHDLVKHISHRKEELQSLLPDIEAQLLEEGQEEIPEASSKWHWEDYEEGQFGKESRQLRAMQDELTIIPAKMAAAHADATIASGVALDGLDRFEASIQALQCNTLIAAVAQLMSAE